MAHKSDVPTRLRSQAYDYVVRLRPDDYFYTPFPEDGVPKHPSAGAVWYSDTTLKCCGNEDIFNVGKTDDMRIFMRRYDDLVSDASLRADLVREATSTNSHWTAESFARLHARKHGIDMRPIAGLSMHSLGVNDRPAS